MIIALTGERTSGKTTASKYLINLGFAPFSFADPIRDVLHVMLGWSYDFMENHKEEVDPEYGICPREGMQVFGTEIGQFAIGEHLPAFQRKVGRTIWAQCFRRWFYQHGMPRQVVIPDMRFRHEYDTTKDLDSEYYVIRVTRDRTFDKYDEHESELHYDEIPADFFIENNDGVGHITLRMKAIMEELL